MNNIKKIGAACAMGAAVIAAATMAWANNGVQRFEFDDGLGPPGTYVACLGEHITFTVHVTGTGREFVTDSGTYHLLDNWKFSHQFTGVLTGRTWVGKGVSPFSANVGPGQAVQWVSRITAKPLTGDGPMFKFENEFKVTVNANGDLVVDRPAEPKFGDSVRCIGKY
jgi:hypothetical protein